MIGVATGLLAQRSLALRTVPEFVVAPAVPPAVLRAARRPAGGPDWARAVALLAVVDGHVEHHC